MAIRRCGTCRRPRSPDLARIEWADAQMPVLRSIRERFASERPLAGVRVGRLPARHGGDGQPGAHAASPAGAEAALCAAEPARPRRTTSPPRWAASVEVHGRRGEDVDAYVANVRRAGRGPAAGHARRRRRPPAVAARAPPGPAARHARRHRGDDHRARCACARSRPRGGSACPVLAVNEAGTERAVQRPLRHRPVDARRHPAGDEPAARRQDVRGARLRLDRQGHRAAGARGGRAGDRLRGRPDAGARGADGGLRGHARARGRRARRRVRDRHRLPRRARRASTSSA